jgi:cysteine desulfurase
MYQGISSISFSGHKFHGPKGIGGLLIKKDFLSEIGPFIIGGHQQNGYRAGTEDVDKLKLFMYSFLESQEDIYDLRGHSKFIHNYFQEEIKRVCNEDMFIINSKDDVVPIINVSFKNISGEYIVKELAKDNIFISTGSACSTGDLSVSDTIKAIGVPVEYQEGTIRISFDKRIGGLHIKTLIDKLVKIFQN